MSNKGKAKVKVWAYSEDGMAKQFDSITEAALQLSENPVTLRKAAIDGRITKKGYLYSFSKLLPSEVQKKFDVKEEKIRNQKKNQLQRENSDCKEFIGSQEFTVDCFNRQITYIPRTKKGKINLLKKLIWTKLEYHWMIIPTKIANIEKRAFQELLDSLA